MEYGRGNAFPLENFKEVREWFSRSDATWNILGSHPESLEQIYGSPNGYFQGSEYLFSIWTVEHEGLTIHLLSSPGKGCCMEVELSPGMAPWTIKDVLIGTRLLTFLDGHLAALESALDIKKPLAAESQCNIESMTKMPKNPKK